MRRSLLALLVGLVAVLTASDVSLAQTPAGKIKAFVSILPQKYFVERVGGEYVEVDVLVGPGQSPHTYEPTPKQMAKLNRSQVYFRIGTTFEKGFIDKISSTFKNVQIVDTRTGVKLRYFKSDKGIQVPDPHIWLDPKRVKTQANTICEALIRIAPMHASEFRENLRAFQADLDRVDAKITEALASVRGKKFYVFHPAFGYFAESYGLTQVAVEIEGKEPSAQQLAALIEKAKGDGVKVIFVQPQFAKRNAEVIARAIGGAVVPMDPLPQDYLKGLEAMADTLKKGLSGD